MCISKIEPFAIDLFCGAGGLSKGLMDANILIKASVEYDKTAIQTYIYNIGNHVIDNDIRNVSSEEILFKAKINTGELFLLAGCPPCQTFSALKKGDSSNDMRNELVFEYVRIALETKPLFILMENVPGMARGRGKEIFKKAKKDLESQYVVIADILNCANYGVPQKRKRLVLHGIRKDIYHKLKKVNPNFQLELPQPTHTEYPDKYPNLQPWVTASVIKGLPPVKAGVACDNTHKPFNHETNGLSEINLKRIQYIRKHGGDRTCLPDALQLPCHKKSKVGYTDVYGLIDYNQPAPTITSGCTCFSKGRFGHPEQDRALTVREAARLQSFDDDFLFWGSRGQAALQVGNAVPPKLAYSSGIYFLHLLDLLKETEKNKSNL